VRERVDERKMEKGRKSQGDELSFLIIIKTT
jgi:hypothetical protein